MEDINQNLIPETTNLEIAVTKPKRLGIKKNNKEKTLNNDVNFQAFYALAELMNKSVEEVKDECCLFQVRNIMNKLTKVIVRYNVSDKELEKILVNCDTLNTNGIMVSPTYLPAIMRQKKKQNLKVNVCSVIDFPFGESLFKSKLNDVRDSIKMGVNGVTVMLPAMLLEGKNVKQFKKQSKKIGKIKRVETSISLSAMDLTSEQIKTAFKITERTKLNAVTFIFGDVGLEEFREKMTVINKYRGKKPIMILANVENVSAVQELIKDQVDGILTPFADEIGTELLKRFDIKSVKVK
ncbi:MAG: hypothetical protein J6R83_01025 [Clostridia bacterium]|nr:hypothetical protein [Clostridia bacterium]